MERRCLTCDRKLKPGTSIPRWTEEMLAGNESTRRSYDSSVAQRQKEIDEERLGLYGESQFCNKDCACFFARTCVNLLHHVEIIPSPSAERFAMVARLATRMYLWVADRKAGK